MVRVTNSLWPCIRISDAYPEQFEKRVGHWVNGNFKSRIRVERNFRMTTTPLKEVFLIISLQSFHDMVKLPTMIPRLPTSSVEEALNRQAAVAVQKAIRVQKVCRQFSHVDCMSPCEVKKLYGGHCIFESMAQEPQPWTHHFRG